MSNIVVKRYLNDERFLVHSDADELKDVTQHLNSLNYSQIQTICQDIEASGQTTLLGQHFCGLSHYFHQYQMITIEKELNEPSLASLQVFKDSLSILHQVNIVFGQCTTMDELCKQAVILAKEYLKIDRAGLLLLSDDKSKMIGTWGTDEEGNLKNEGDFVGDLPASPWVEETLTQQGFVKIWTDVPLKNYGEVVGTGWNAMVSIWNGTTPIGWLACDNLLGGGDMNPALETLLAVYGASIGQWYVRKSGELDLQAANENLAQIVDDKTRKLQQTIDSLISAKDKLVSAEKTKALSHFTAGIAHEINNPIGFITSNLKFIDKACSKALEQLEKVPDVPSQVIGMLKEIDDVLTESHDGLDRVTDIIRMLQPLNKLANEPTQKFNLSESIRFLLNGLIIGAADVKIHLPKDDIYVQLPLQAFTLSIEKIIENALDAINGREKGSINIYTFNDGEHFSISVADNGEGIAPENIEQIFNPFYTTKPVGSGTGLGLSLAENLIKIASGEIKIVSDIQKGTIASLIFPAGVIANG